ncbi:MAG: adenosine deaminase [Rhodobacteraceae bacterium]|nr:adenosine deaminase [Paracoccaceae bacterium]
MNFSEIPKTELHLHLEGAAPPAFIRRLAQEKGVNMGGVFDENGAYVWSSFVEFLATYERACEVLKTPEDFGRLVSAVLEEQAAHGVIYTEMFLAPDFCGGGDLIAWREYLAAMSEAALASPVEARFIPTCVRHFGPEQARVSARVSAETAGGLVTGFGMGGDESQYRAADFAYAFDMAREAELGLTSHAGEVEGPQSVRETLEALKVSRIGHGVRAIEDPALVAELAERGVVLEVCPGSNIALKVYDDLKAHPISALREAGVLVTVSTDDPPYFHTDMSAEYRALNKTPGWTRADFDAINRTAMNAAFCDTETKNRLLAKFNGA